MWRRCRDAQRRPSPRPALRRSPGMRSPSGRGPRVAGGEENRHGDLRRGPRRSLPQRHRHRRRRAGRPPRPARRAGVRLRGELRLHVPPARRGLLRGAAPRRRHRVGLLPFEERDRRCRPDCLWRLGPHRHHGGYGLLGRHAPALHRARRGELLLRESPLAAASAPRRAGPRDQTGGSRDRRPDQLTLSCRPAGGRCSRRSTTREPT
jgi:hypothetical protein